MSRRGTRTPDALRGVPWLAVRLLPADVVERWYLPAWYDLQSRHVDGAQHPGLLGAHAAAVLLHVRAAVALADCARLVLIGQPVRQDAPTH